jgi:hypothetical protein
MDGKGNPRNECPSWGWLKSLTFRRRESSSCRRRPASRFVLKFKFQNRLDSGMRRNDGTRVDFHSTNSEPLGFEPTVVYVNQFRG